MGLGITQRDERIDSLDTGGSMGVVKLRGVWDARKRPRRGCGWRRTPWVKGVSDCCTGIGVCVLASMLKDSPDDEKSLRNDAVSW